jgi:uncharacterized protein (TIGR03067 family)
MKSNLLALLVLFGAWSAIATGQGGDEKKELEKFKGTWKLIGEVDSGQNIPADPNEVFIFNGNNLLIKLGLKITEEFDLKVNPTKTPKEMDLISIKEPNKGVPFPAIYKMEGNKLSICVNFALGGKRPTDFISTAENRNLLKIMEKIQKNQK